MSYHNDDYGVKEDPLTAHTGAKGRERTFRHTGRLFHVVLAVPVVLAVVVAGAQVARYDQSESETFTATDRALIALEAERISNRENLNAELADGFTQIRVHNEQKAEAARLEAERIEAERLEAERVAAEQAEQQRLAAEQAERQRQAAATTTTLPAPAEVAPAAPSEPVSTGGGSGGLPPDSYWDRMAMCETGGNWAHYPYGTWTGGLGIYNQTWRGWGGLEFAPTAGQATREQQIIVANRIATQGYGNLGPVGYSAWGCLATVGYP